MTRPPPRSPLFPSTPLSRSHHEPSELLLSPRREERRSLHRLDPRPDPEGLEIPGHRLTHRGVGRERVEVAGVEAVGVAGLDEELLGSPGIVGRRVEGQRVLEGSWNYAPGGSGEA